MPSESRVIKFTDRELLEAVAAYCVKSARLAPGAAITSPLVSNEGEIKLSFEPSPSGPVVTLRQNEILAAIILYCGQRRIPIPRRSIKSLRVANGGLSLHLETPR
ncbi:MAG TPA: hypothetical protein VMU06_16745 [Stellaceae bacterium]|nr:hypothetical protein [Stellaceae bacterium]